MTLYKGPHSLMRVLAPKFRLNRVEYLMLYNLRPQSQVELQLIIEEVRHARPVRPAPPSTSRLQHHYLASFVLS